MPSIQSHLFRQLARFGSRYTDRALARSVDVLRRDARRPAVPPRGTTVEAIVAGGVPGEWVSAANARAGCTIYYLHGGGWIMGWGPVQRRMAGQFSQLTGARVLGIDYRLAPEHPFPAALEDCVAAYRWLLEQGPRPESIVMLGDSAGGNLVVTTMLAARDAGLPLPAAAVCISPAADLTGETMAPDAAPDPMLSRSSGEFMARAYVGDHDPHDPLISPIFADLRGLPPVLMQAGEVESLRPGIEQLAAGMRAAGVDVTLEVWPTMWHVWHVFAPWLPEAQVALERIGGFIRQHMPVTAESSQVHPR